MRTRQTGSLMQLTKSKPWRLGQDKDAQETHGDVGVHDAEERAIGDVFCRQDLGFDGFGIFRDRCSFASCSLEDQLAFKLVLRKSLESPRLGITVALNGQRTAEGVWHRNVAVENLTNSFNEIQHQNFVHLVLILHLTMEAPREVTREKKLWYRLRDRVQDKAWRR